MASSSFKPLNPPEPLEPSRSSEKPDDVSASSSDGTSEVDGTSEIDGTSEVSQKFICGNYVKKFRTFCQTCLCPIDKQKKCSYRNTRSLVRDDAPHLGMFIGVNPSRFRDNLDGSTTCFRCLRTGSFYGDIDIDCLFRKCLIVRRRKINPSGTPTTETPAKETPTTGTSSKT